MAAGPDPRKPVPVLRPASLDGVRVNGGFSTRLGGVSEPPFHELNLSHSGGDDRSAVAENLLRWCRACGLSRCPPLVQRQVHGAAVTWVGGPDGASRAIVAGREADALATAEAGLPLAIQVADCVPILLWDPRAPAVAAVHAGWRGTAAGVVGAAIETMVQRAGTNPENLRAALGPAIGGCCYVVGPEVVEALAAVAPTEVFVEPVAGGRPRVDLRRANRAALVYAGVPEDAVELVGGCTCCDPDLYSYRRDGPRTGRLMGVIEIR